MKLKFSKFGWTNYELFFVLFFSWIYIVNPVAGLFRSLLGNTHSLEVLILDVFLFLLFLNVLNNLIKRIKLWQIAAIFILLLLLVISTIFSSETKTNDVVMLRVVTESVPIFILAGCVRDYDKVYRYIITLMRIYAYVGFFVFRFLYFGVIGDDNFYSAEMTYQWLFPATVLLYDVINHFSWRSLIPMLISIFSVIGFGSRGPLVCIILSLLTFILVRSGSLKDKLKVLIPVALLAGLVVVNSEKLIFSMTNLLINTGLTDRSLTYLNSEVLQEDARAQLISIATARIKDNPIIGTGLVNDRIYIKRALSSYEDAHGWYPHNFFLEILMQFGLIVGIIILIVFIRFLIRCYKLSPTQEARSVLIIFIGAYLYPLLFSGSYLEWRGFYALMGMSGAIMALHKQQMR